MEEDDEASQIRDYSAGDTFSFSNTGITATKSAVAVSSSSSGDLTSYNVLYTTTAQSEDLLEDEVELINYLNGTILNGVSAAPTDYSLFLMMLMTQEFIGLVIHLVQ